MVFGIWLVFPWLVKEEPEYRLKAPVRVSGERLTYVR